MQQLVASARCHMIITCKPCTWRESDWCNRIQTCQVSKTQKALDVYQTLSFFWGWGLGARLEKRVFFKILKNFSIRSIRLSTVYIDLSLTFFTFMYVPCMLKYTFMHGSSFVCMKYAWNTHESSFHA